MAKVKPTARPPPGIYRDEPDRDDAASTSSAVPMGSVDFHEENNYPDSELPAYEDVPSTSAAPIASTGHESSSTS